MPTPYDGKVAIWYVYGGMIGETTIDEVVGTLKSHAPAVSAVFVKVTDGTDWMGTFESSSKRDLAINGPSDIQRWIAKLASQNLEFHAWALPKGVNPEAEANLMLQVCQLPGVKSLILDVEAGTGFFRGGREAIRPLMTRLRGGLPGAFHIGLSVDPRPAHHDEIFPDEWFPFVNSVHPQVYWGEFSQTPDVALQSAYATWSNYGRPIIPVLQGYNVSQSSMDSARKLAVRTYNATGISWYTFGAIGPTGFPAVNVSIADADKTTTGEGDQAPVEFTGRYGTEIVVTPDSPAYRDGTYDNSPAPFQTFRNNAGWTTKYVPTRVDSSTVWARWDPQLPTGGFWEVSAFVASQHATTTSARFKIHGIVGGVSDYAAPIAEIPIDDLWVSLGIYNFQSGDTTAGVIFLNDLTGENNREIAFDAIRWRQVLDIPTPPAYLADGFDSPLGAAADRKLTKLWPPIWYTSNGYENFYYLGPGNTNPALHTGDDLILYDPATGTRQDCAHQPIYAAASGVVASAERQTGSWGNVIVIQHDPYIGTGQVAFTRYGHVENMQVKAGDRVVRGQHIANVGNAFGRFVYHLHFDLSLTRVLQTRPWDWPGLSKQRLEANYLNPYQFILNHRPTKP
jgi:hypothetical protein